MMHTHSAVAQDDYDFRYDAACKGQPTELFFTEDDKAPVIDIPGTAGYFCARCSVRDQCLEDALQTKEFDGVRGGCNVTQRKAILRKRRKEQMTALRSAEASADETLSWYSHIDG